MTFPCALYRNFDELGTLLYVGVSSCLERRFQRHVLDSEWVQFASRGSLEWFPTVSAALVAETLAIHSEGPVFNRAGSVGDPDVRIAQYYARRGAERKPTGERRGRLIELRRSHAPTDPEVIQVDLDAVSLSQAAECLKMPRKTLANARDRDPRFPKSIDRGQRGSMLYRFEDLKAWAIQRYQQGRAAS